MATNSQIAFSPLGNTVAITAAATAPNGVQALVSERNSPNSPGQYRVINSSTVMVHLGVGATVAKAKANAVAAASGNPAAGIPLVPGAVEILRFGPEAYFSALAASSATIYITPGQGI
jgi:hypothetical protein